jgi:hypothetical protein
MAVCWDVAPCSLEILTDDLQKFDCLLYQGVLEPLSSSNFIVAAVGN